MFPRALHSSDAFKMSFSANVDATHNYGQNFNQEKGVKMKSS